MSKGNEHGFIHHTSPVKRSRSNHEWYEFQLQTSPSKVQRVVGFNVKTHGEIKHLEETKTPVLLKNVIVKKDGDWVFNQQSSVFVAPNSDISFTYKEQPSMQRNALGDMLGVDVGKISELQTLTPNQKVNVRGTLSLGEKKPKEVVIRSTQENCLVKEDCIIEDETGHSVINIWGPAIQQLKDGHSYSFKNVTVKNFQSKVFLSTTPSTTFEEIEKKLSSLNGPTILKVEDEEVWVDKFKLVSKLLIFVSCQVCKKRIDNVLVSCVKCANCGSHQRLTDCKREGSVKLCIRVKNEDLWLTCFTEALTTLLKESSSVTLENTTDEVAEAIMNAENFFLSYDCENKVVKQITKVDMKDKDD